MAIRVGTTFHFNDRLNEGHLFLIISSPSYPQVVVVNMTTPKRFSDTSCLLNKGDHPFVEHETCIAYEYAEIISTIELQEKESCKVISIQEPLSSQLLIRIWEGAAMTQHLPLGCTEILRDQNLI